MLHPRDLRRESRHGAGRGAKIGFPTANLDAVDTLVPGAGVYAGRGMVCGVTWPAAIHVGPIPTFGDHALKIEVHLIGATSAIYGEPLELVAGVIRRALGIETKR